MGHVNYGGFIHPFTVASREVTMAARRTPTLDYIFSIINVIGIPAVTAAALGFIYNISQRDNFHILLTTWSSLGFISILTLIHKEVRFITFLTPAIALLSIEGIYIFSKILVNIILKDNRKVKTIKIIGIITLILLSISQYSYVPKYTIKYYYAGSSQAMIFNELKTIIPSTSNITILVSPNLYPYAGIFFPSAKVYQMSSYRLNWLIHGIRGQPPDVSEMLKQGDFKYIIYCRFPHLTA